jgi:hypothetical protein
MSGNGGSGRPPGLGEAETRSHVREGTDAQAAFKILADLKNRVDAIEETSRGAEQTPTLYRDEVETVHVFDSISFSTFAGTYKYDTDPTVYDYSQYADASGRITRRTIKSEDVQAGESVTIAQNEYGIGVSPLDVGGRLEVGGEMDVGN